MRAPEFYSAVYAIIKNDKGEILFMRRKNSGFKDGYLQLPAGHVEGEETITASCRREMKEELNIDIQESDLEVIHVSHRNSTGRVYFDIYLEVKKYEGELKINEPHKCSELKYVDIEHPPTDDFVQYDIDCMKKVKNGEIFSEV